MENLIMKSLLLCFNLFLGTLIFFPAVFAAKNPDIPANMKEIPFVDNAPEPVPTTAENKAGFIVFSRAITAPIYPATKPLAGERITELRSFGAQGQYVNLNFAVYPLRELKQLRVLDTEIHAQHELRYVEYRYNYFPFYTSHDSCRRGPEPLMPHENDLPLIPRYEPQRFLLTVKVPDNAAGKITGNLRICVAGKEVFRLPYTIKVLPFKLKRDTAKYFSSYNSDIRSWVSKYMKSRKDDKEFLHRAQLDQFRRMKEYGFNMPPILYLAWRWNDDKGFELRNFDEQLAEMREVGLPFPFAIVCGAAEDVFYRKHTGKKLDTHCVYEVEPPQAMYDDMAKTLREFCDSRKGKSDPPFIYGPIDEPDPQSLPMVKKVYKIFKDQGLRTYITSCPFEEKVGDVVDFWSDQPFRPFSEVMKRDKKMYICYPNHNSYEIKDCSTMCRGGRMTYGYGFWKSDYNMLVPWKWLIQPLEFGSKWYQGGNSIAPDGKTIMSMTWECFREGIIDGCYIYTLSDAIVKREPAHDPKLAKLLTEACELLQKHWNDTPAMTKYLSEGHFTDEEFDGKRAELAEILTKIIAYPETNSVTAPSIIVDVAPKNKTENFAAICAAEEERGNIRRFKVPFEQWTPYEDEAKKLKIEPDITRLHVSVDQKHDGSGNNGKYPCNWPRLRAKYGEKPVDLSCYDLLSFRMRVNSNRDGQYAVNWPLKFYFCPRGSDRTHGAMLFSRVEPKEWKRYIFSVNDLISESGISRDDLKQISAIQFCIFEHFYRHGDDLNLDFADIEFLGFKTPIIGSFEVAPAVAKSSPFLSWRLKVFGEIPKNTVYRITLTDASGTELAANSEKLTANLINGAISLDQVRKSGNYTLKIELCDSASKKLYSQQNRTIRLVDL